MLQLRDHVAESRRGREERAGTGGTTLSKCCFICCVELLPAHQAPILLTMARPSSRVTDRDWAEPNIKVPFLPPRRSCS